MYSAVAAEDVILRVPARRGPKNLLFPQRIADRKDKQILLPLRGIRMTTSRFVIQQPRKWCNREERRNPLVGRRAKSAGKTPADFYCANRPGSTASVGNGGLPRRIHPVRIAAVIGASRMPLRKWPSATT